MNLKSFLECERKSLEKMKRYQLSNRFKKIGIGIIIVSLILFFINKFSVENSDLKLSAKYLILVGLLIISVSKEKIEDELIKTLRMQSYTFAFIAGVIITLLTNPLFNFIANMVSLKQDTSFKEVGDWEILWILLSVQVFYFELLKRLNK